jgi:hypothetical protein
MAPESRAVQAAAEAMGGKEKIQAVKTVSIQGEGENGNPGQSLTPDSPATKWKVTGFKQTIDFDNKRMHIEEVRTAQFPFPLDNVVNQSESVDHDIAWNKTGDQVSPRMSDRTARERQLEILRNPIGIMRAAIDPANKRGNYRQEGNRQVIDITTADGQMLTLSINAESHLPASVISAMDQPNLGDVDVETTFADFQDVDGLKLPMRLTTKIDKWMQSDIRVSRYILNPNAGSLAAPDSLKAENAAPADPPVEVTSEPLTKGIWLLGGTGASTSVAFEFSDHLTLFGLPDSEARARAVIEKAHSLRFGKPLTEVVIVNHHFDHSAGLRVAVANGLIIITQRANVAFFKDLIARKHTMVPDELAKTLAPQRAQFKPVDDELVLKDDAMELDLYHVKENPYADTLLMGWVPRERLLVQADLYGSEWATHPWAENLLKNVELRKLNPERDVPSHGRVEPWAEVLQNLHKK